MKNLQSLVAKPHPVALDVDDPVYVKALCVADVDRLEAPDGTEESRAEKLCYWAELFLCDENGESLIVTDEDRAILRQLPLPVIKQIVDTGLAANGLGSAEQAADAEADAKKE